MNQRYRHIHLAVFVLYNTTFSNLWPIFVSSIVYLRCVLVLSDRETKQTRDEKLQTNITMLEQDNLYRCAILQTIARIALKIHSNFAKFKIYKLTLLAYSDRNTVV